MRSPWIIKPAPSSKTWASPMNKTQPYRNISCSFIHDDRGRFCPQGSTAWLRPVRAKKILDECEGLGIFEAITPIDMVGDSGAESESLNPPLSEKPGSGSAPITQSPSLMDSFLSLHHTRRKKVARLLGAQGKVKIQEADTFIKAADADELENLAHILTEV